MINQSDHHFKSTIMACTIHALCLLIGGSILAPSFKVCAQQYLIENQKPNKIMPLNSTQLVNFLSTSKQKIILTNNKLEFNRSSSIKNDNKKVIREKIFMINRKFNLLKKNSNI